MPSFRGFHTFRHSGLQKAQEDQEPAQRSSSAFLTLSAVLRLPGNTTFPFLPQSSVGITPEQGERPLGVKDAGPGKGGSEFDSCLLNPSKTALGAILPSGLPVVSHAAASGDPFHLAEEGDIDRTDQRHHAM